MTLHVGSVGSPIRANTMEPEVLRQLIGITSGMSSTAGPPQGILGAGDFAITQASTPNMSVNVGAGFGVVAGTNNSPVQGCYNVYNDAAVNLAITAANAGNPRIDVVCVTIQDAFYSGSANTGLLQVITGTPSGTPLVPAIPANSLALGHIYVGAGVTSILNANINSTSGAGNPDTIAFTPLRRPPGNVGLYLNTSSNSTMVTATAPPGNLLASVVVNLNANRLIRVHVNGRISISAPVNVNVTRDGTSIADISSAQTGNGQTTDGTVFDQPSAGLHTYAIYGWGAVTSWAFQGGGTYSDQWSLSVDDVGPAS